MSALLSCRRSTAGKRPLSFGEEFLAPSSDAPRARKLVRIAPKPEAAANDDDGAVVLSVSIARAEPSRPLGAPLPPPPMPLPPLTDVLRHFELGDDVPPADRGRLPETPSRLRLSILAELRAVVPDRLLWGPFADFGQSPIRWTAWAERYRDDHGAADGDEATLSRLMATFALNHHGRHYGSYELQVVGHALGGSYYYEPRKKALERAHMDLVALEERLPEAKRAYYLDRHGCLPSQSAWWRIYLNLVLLGAQLVDFSESGRPSLRHHSLSEALPDRWREVRTTMLFSENPMKPMNERW